ncbi:MAG TPA: cytochrome b N-terminal domain-containing protein, partial [Polyangiaceae bacterium]
VERIVGELPYGNLIRSFHVWASDLFVVCLLAHLFTIVVRRTFRPPHELTWLSGVVALVLGIGMAFTGAILPWNEAAYTNARVGSQLAKYVPLLGTGLQRFMRGGDEVTSATLGHAYGFHVAALPAAITVLVALHLFFLSRKPATITVLAEPEAPSSSSRSDEASAGDTEPTDGEVDAEALAKAEVARAALLRDTIPLYPDFLVRLALPITGVLVLIMTLAVFADRPLGVAADPALASVGTRPPWYLLPVHELVRMAPKELLGIDGARFLVGAATFLGLFVAALPFIDRRGSKITAYLAWSLLLVLIILATLALN